MLRYGIIGLLFLTNLGLVGAAQQTKPQLSLSDYDELYQEALESNRLIQENAKQKDLILTYSAVLANLLINQDDLVLVEHLFWQYIYESRYREYSYLINQDFATKKKLLISSLIKFISQLIGKGVEESKGVPADLEQLVAEAYTLLEQTVPGPGKEKIPADQGPVGLIEKPGKAPSPAEFRKIDQNNLVFLEKALKDAAEDIKQPIAYDGLLRLDLKDKQAILQVFTLDN